MTGNLVIPSLQSFTDLLSIPPAVSQAEPTTSSSTTLNTSGYCFTHRVYCESEINPNSLLPLDLFVKTTPALLRAPTGPDAFLIVLADSLVLAGVGLAVGVVVYFVRE